MMRSFLAIPIPDETTDALVRVQGLIPVGRTVPEENLHLTLAFLGDTSGSVLEALNDMLSAARLPAPDIRFGGLGTFAEMERGLVFAEVTADPGLTALHDKVAHIARGAGADLPRRRFRPHVTLARANRQPRGLARDRLAAALGLPVEIPGFTAEAVTLYRSDIGPTGACHTPLAHYPLGEL